MKKIYFIVLLLMLASCSKNDNVVPDETNRCLTAINDFRINQTPPLNILNWDSTLLKACEISVSYFNENGVYPEVSSVAKEAGVSGAVCYIWLDTSNVKDFDIVNYLKTTANSFTSNPKYTKFATYTKGNGTSICFGYEK